MVTPVGPLEVPEGLLQALAGSGERERTTHVTDLPFVVIVSILARIPNPVDIASAFTASRLFWCVGRTAPFRLRLLPGRNQNGCGDDTGLANRTTYDAQKIAAWTRAGLRGIRRVMRGTQELNLSGCPILDDDVAAVLADLRCLDGLILDGCQKLTSSVAHALGVSVRSGPRLLSLQRCYRLGHAAAGNLLAAAATDGSRLRTLLLSHLDKLDLPWDPPVLEPVGDEMEGSMEVMKGIGSSYPGAGLRILALHNCGSLGCSELLAIAEACPYLEVLMLGGSVDGLGLARPDSLTQDKVIAAASALVRVTEILPKLRILEITFFTASLLQAVREQALKSIQIWDFCDNDSVARAAAFAARLKSCSDSFGGETSLSISQNDQDRVQSKVLHSTNGDGSLETVNFGLHFVNGAATTQRFYTRQGFEKKWHSTADDVLMALRAGTNCSDIRRRTPLHVAAACGDPAVAANLLFIGAAASGMKDTGGATALFVAAENGHALICDHLLRGGADVLASNRAGETPLYIAALRGHSAAVEVMLAHCQDHGINWQDANVYSDGWTPLMAATVADRQEVGKVLLWAAGTSIQSSQGKEHAGLNPLLRYGSQVDDMDETTHKDKSLGILPESTREESTGYKGVILPGSAPLLLNAQNRYGQTALHIAARQGSKWFLVKLLHAGASVDVRDEFGLRAVDVAHKQNHTSIEKILKDWEQEQRKAHMPSERATSKKQPRTGKKAVPSNKQSLRPNQSGHISGRGSALWVPKSSTVNSDVPVEVNNSHSRLDTELPSPPDSPTSIVPNWMHLSPPLSPCLRQVPVFNDADAPDLMEGV